MIKTPFFKELAASIDYTVNELIINNKIESILKGVCNAYKAIMHGFGLDSHIMNI